MSLENYEIEVTYDKAEISFNFDETKDKLATQMEIYKNLELTDEKVPELKSDVAVLRKIRDAIETRRKQVKREYNEPLTEFEKKVKELVKIIDEPIDLIAKKTKEYDQKCREEKKIKIKEVFDRLVNDDVKNYIEFDKLYNPSWEVKSKSLKAIEAEISNYISSTEMSLSTIKSFDSDAVDDALVIYMNSGELARAISHINDYEKQKAEIIKREEERKRLEEEKRQREAEQREKEELERKRIDDEVAAEKEQKEMAKRIDIPKMPILPEDTSAPSGFTTTDRIDSKEIDIPVVNSYVCEGFTTAVAQGFGSGFHDVVEKSIPETFTYSITCDRTTKEKLDAWLSVNTLHYEVE